ncbi:sensor histidine kinase [Nitrincola schmidtii]|uniref:sensor histidine kinase n=1 Tax=Nitrincola schmidtii TaxID=1730894 RepID=UPI00124D6DD1|nr:PhnD/SsuA/transferrin family substrate-binding protein [Nitrincola schmidtii]
MIWAKQIQTLLVLILLHGFALQLAAEEIHIGILDWRTLEDFEQHWLPSLQSLETEMPAHRLVLHAMTLEELNKALAEHQLDFLITNPGHYVALSAQYEIAPLAQLQHLKEGLPLNYVGSVLLTHQGRQDLNEFSDLKGLRVGAVSLESFGGYQLMLDTLNQHHNDVNRWAINWSFTGFPMDQLVERLLHDEFDAIVLRSCLAEVMALEGSLDLTALRPIGAQSIDGYPCMISTPVYPGWPLLRTARANDTLARQVLAALMKSDSVLIEQDVVHWQPPVSYQSVYDVFERLRIGPFAAFPHNPILHWLLIHRYWFYGAFTLLILLVLHNIRAEYLVRRRTHELELSQQRHREAEQTAQHHQDELRHASRFTLMGELAAGLAHELNQPLTAIANYARGSVRHLQRDNQDLLDRRVQLVEASEQIANQADQAAAVIRNIRTFLKKDAGEYSWLAIVPVVEDALLFCQTRLNQAQVKPDLQFSSHLPDIFSHRIYLLQILANLITNALDAMVDEEVSQRELRLSISQDVANNRLIIQLFDRGKGIDAGIEKHLFEPFMTTRKEGMGLGLSLSRSLAEALGGELTLINRQDGGAVATLTIPIQQPLQESIECRG